MIANTSGTPESNSVANASDILLKVARPDLYRTNAFRMLELPVDASPRDLAKRQQIIELAGKTESPVPSGSSCTLPLEGASEPGVMSETLQHLQDPERRLADELFWFWPHQPGQSKQDEALLALAEGDLARARTLWTTQQENGDNGVSSHNLAVLAHAVALDWEYRGATDGALAKSDVKQRNALWAKAFAHWSELLDQPEFWSRLRARIRALDYPQLTTGVARRFRETLPLALLSVNAQLAVSAAERRDSANAKRHLQLIRKSGLEMVVADEALQRAARPIRERIKTLCKMAEPEADADPIHADAICRRLLDQTKPLLAVLATVLPKGNTIRDDAHDEVALCALACQIPYANKTGNWETSVALLEAAAELATGESTRSRFQENLRICRKNATSGSWWCGHGYFDLPQALLALLETAHRHADLKQWDDAVPILEELQRDPQVAADDMRHVDKALAYCLNLRAVDRVNEGQRELTAARTLLTKVKARGFMMNDSASILSRLSQGFGAPFLECQACGSRITGQYAVATFDGAKYNICSSCNSEDDREMRKRKSSFHKVLKAAMWDMLLARELDPGPSAVEENISMLRSVASELGLSVPKKPRKRPSRARRPATTAPSRTLTPARIIIFLALVAIATRVGIAVLNALF